MLAQKENEMNAPQDRKLPSFDLLDGACIKTPEITKLVNISVEQMRLDHPGMIVVGRQRVGKTRALDFLEGVVSDQMHYPVYTQRWIAPKEEETEVNFIEECVRQSGCDISNARKLPKLRNDLVRFLVGEAARSTTKRLMLIVDEAQCLDDSEYGQLVHIHNSLESRGLRPFIMLVGQPELANVEGLWLERKALQYVGRFASRIHEFEGVLMSDLPEILVGFDDDTDGVEQCAAFRTSPSDYLAGWRVAELAGLIQEAVRSVALRHGLTEDIRLPMQYVRSCILALLLHINQSGCDPRKVALERAIECVLASNLGKVLQYYIERKKNGKI